MAAEGFHDRRKLSGGKNDRLDAEVLAEAVRTDWANFRALLPDSPLAAEIATLARDRQALVREHTRLTNRLRSALNGYFPAALITFDLDADSTLAFSSAIRPPWPQRSSARSRSPASWGLAWRTAILRQRPRRRKKPSAHRRSGPAHRAPGPRPGCVRVIGAQLQALRPELSAYEQELDNRN